MMRTTLLKRVLMAAIALALFTAVPGCWWGHDHHDDRDHHDDHHDDHFDH